MYHPTKVQTEQSFALRLASAFAFFVCPVFRVLTEASARRTLDTPPPFFFCRAVHFACVQNPTHVPTHDPTPRPTLRPTLPPLTIAVVGSAVVLDGVSAAQWRESDSACDAVLRAALVDCLALVSSPGEVTGINATSYGGRRRRLTARPATSAATSPAISVGGVAGARGLSGTDSLVRFSVDVEEDPLKPELSSGASVLVTFTSELNDALASGNFAIALLNAAAARGNTLLVAATVNVAASEAAAAAFGSVSEYVVNRFPTPLPTHSYRPSIGPTKEPTKVTKSPTAAVSSSKGAGWGNPNPWLVVVIGLEIAISFALCVCCMKVGSPPPGPVTDPMALTALAVRLTNKKATHRSFSLSLSPWLLF